MPSTARLRRHPRHRSCSTGGAAGRGYALNKFLMSLNDARQPRGVPGRRGAPTSTGSRSTTSSGRRCCGREWLRLLELGGNVYYTYKLAACDGMTFQDLAGRADRHDRRGVRADDARRAAARPTGTAAASDVGAAR